MNRQCIQLLFLSLMEYFDSEKACFGFLQEVLGQWDFSDPTIWIINDFYYWGFSSHFAIDPNVKSNIDVTSQWIVKRRFSVGAPSDMQW